MATNDPLARLRAMRGGGTVTQQDTVAPDPLSRLRALRTVAVEEKIEEDDRNDLLQAGAGVLEGVLDPLSVIPFVDRRLAELEAYRGQSTGGKIGYGIGAIGGFFIPLAPANLTLRAGTATAKGLRMVKKLESTEDVANLANKLTDLNLAGEFVQGAVAGGLYGAGIDPEDGETRAVNALQNALLGGIGDVAIMSVWRGISAMHKATKTVAPELKNVAQEALTTGKTDNAPVIRDERTAQIIGRALTLADNVLGTGADQDAKLEMGLSLARALQSVEAGELRVIPKMARNQGEFVRAVKEQGLEVIEATKGDNSSFLIGMPGSISKSMADEFGHYGYVTGQSVLTMAGKDKSVRGTILGRGKEGVRVLLPGRRVKEVPEDQLLFMPIGVTKGVKRSIGAATKLWADFKSGYDEAFSSDVLAEEARKLGIATGTDISPPPTLSFDGAFEKFAKDNNIVGAEKQVLKDYFIRRHADDVRKIAPEEMEILDELKRVNKEFYPTGHLNETAAARGYKVVKFDYNGKSTWGVRDVNTGQTQPYASKKLAEAAVKSHMRDLPDMLDGLPLPVSEDILNTGGVAGALDEAGIESQWSAEELSKMQLGGIVTATKLIPRVGYLRAIEDIAVGLGKRFPLFTEVFDPISRANTNFRNAANPYITELHQIVGRSWRRNIRRDKSDEFVQLMESDPVTWKTKAKELDLNGKEVKAAHEMRGLLNKLWEKEAISEEVGMSANEFISFYWPRFMRSSKEGAQGKTFKEIVTEEALSRKMVVSDKTMSFFNDMERTGRLTRYETDPLVVMHRYINGMMFKKHAAEAYDKSIATFKSLAKQYENDEQLAPHLVIARDYINLMQGWGPEEWASVNAAFRNLAKHSGMTKHIDEDTMSKAVVTWASLNNGAFLGFRPAKVLMNATQIGHVVIKDGSKYAAKGLKAATSKAGADEALREGAYAKHQMRVPFADQIADRTAKAEVEGQVSGFRKLIDAGLELTEIGMRPFSKADDFLRTIAYHSQKIRAVDAYTEFRTKKGWDGISENLAFEEEAGLSAMGDAIKKQYYKIVRDSGNDAAARWLGVQAANDTQYMYQTGAGPIAFSRGAGKLFGQYGTWPVWYVNWMKRGLTTGTKKDRIRFATRNAVWNGAMVAAGYTTGVEITRWLGPTSVFYSGGPILEKANDLRVVWGGIGRDVTGGNMPIEAKLALAKYGIKYDEDGISNYDLDDPAKLAANTVGLAVPGVLAGKDIGQAVESAGQGNSLYRNLMIGLGFDMREEDGWIEELGNR